MGVTIGVDIDADAGVSLGVGAGIGVVVALHQGLTKKGLELVSFVWVGYIGDM